MLNKLKEKKTLNMLMEMSLAIQIAFLTYHKDNPDLKDMYEQNVEDTKRYKRELSLLK